MSFLKQLINSIARTFGRIIAYAIIGLLLALLASNFVHASTWVSIYDKSNLNNNTYIYYNHLRFMMAITVFFHCR